MDNYTAETKQALSNYFDRDTQFLLQSFLKSCEGLPDCYIEFQRQMYKPDTILQKDYICQNLLCLILKKEKMKKQDKFMYK